MARWGQRALPFGLRAIWATSPSALGLRTKNRSSSREATAEPSRRCSAFVSSPNPKLRGACPNPERARSNDSKYAFLSNFCRIVGPIRVLPVLFPFGLFLLSHCETDRCASLSATFPSTNHSGIGRGRPAPLTTFNLETDNLAGFALRKDFKWPATHLTVSRKPLTGNTRIENQVKLLTAIRTLDSC